MLYVSVITIFPQIIEEYAKYGILKRALDKRVFRLSAVNLRGFTTDKHQTVDDRPFGGGPGMVLKLGPLVKAIEYTKSKVDAETKVWLFAASGTLFTQKQASHIAKFSAKEDLHLILLCGRYEGIDARIEHFVDAKLSIGPYVLTGGELPALVVTDAIVRLLEGSVGNPESLKEETSFKLRDGIVEVEGEYPQYTRPAVFEYKGKKYKVPDVLLTGDHKKIKQWRDSQKRRQVWKLE